LLLIYFDLSGESGIEIVSQLLLPNTIKSAIPKFSVTNFQTMFHTHTEEQVIFKAVCVVNVSEGATKHMKQDIVRFKEIYSAAITLLV
jgi:hypothetical protein